MKKYLSVFLTVIIVLTSSTSFAGQWRRDGECKNTCDNIENFKECLNKEKEFPPELQAEIDAVDFGQVDPQCAAAKANEIGNSTNFRLTISYTIAAAICVSACAAIGLAWTNGAAYEIACTIASGGAAIHDFTENQFITKKLNEMYWHAGGAAVGSFAAGYGASEGIKEGAKKGIAGAKVEGEFSLSCVTMGWLLLIASLKNGSTQKAKTNGSTACNEVKSLQSNVQALEKVCKEYIPTEVEELDTFSTMGSLSNSNISKPDSAGTGPKEKEKDSPDSNVEDASISSLMNLAAKDPLGGKLLRNAIDNDPKKAERIANRMGLTPANVAKALESQTPAQFASGLSGLPPALKKAIKDTEKLVKDLKIDPSLNQSVYAMPSSGKDGQKQPPKIGVFFDDEESGPGAVTKNLSFRKEELKKAYEEQKGDIWHVEWKGSIFDLVSVKIEKCIDRVDKKEWQSRMNRAIHRLPVNK